MERVVLYCLPVLTIPFGGGQRVKIAWVSINAWCVIHRKTYLQIKDAMSVRICYMYIYGTRVHRRKHQECRHRAEPVNIDDLMI